MIVPVRLEDIAPDGAFLYELASRNWINAYEDTEARLAELAKGLAQMVRSGTRDESVLPFDRSDDGRNPLPRKRTRKPVLVAAAMAFVIASAAIAAWLLWPPQHWTVESSRPFISTLALEDEPAFSSDGKTLAYTSGTGPLSRKIYMRNVAGGDGIKVTSDAYDDVSPTWSPDGTRIAYVAQKKGEACRIMVETLPAGAAREVGRCVHSQSTSVSWRPATSFLYYYDLVDVTGDSILRLDLDSGARVRLAKKPSFQEMVHLQCSPDGKSLLYLWRISASTSAMVIRDLASGKERTLGNMVGRGSAAWSEDSRAVLAATASGIGSEITAYPLSGEAPYHVYAAAINVSHLAASVGGLLALETVNSRENLARASLVPAAQPDIIESVNGRTWAPTFAPDGTLAFLSNRSGTNAVWVLKPGAAPALLFDAGLVDLFRLEYSPDGTWLAAAIGKADGVTIKIRTADGGTMASFDSPTLGFGQPSWTPDSKQVVLVDRQKYHDVSIAIDNPAQRNLIGPAPPWGPIAIRGNDTFSARIDKSGLWQIDKGTRLISSKYPTHFDPPITFRGDDVLIPDFDAEGSPRILAQPLAGGPDWVVAYAPGAEVKLSGLESKMAVNPRTGEIIYVASVLGDTNIDLLTLVRH